MKSIYLNITSIVTLIILSGCSSKQLEPKVEYVYLPCKQKVHFPIVKKQFKPLTINSKLIANTSSKKHAAKYKQPRPIKIYAPKKYMTRENKEMDFMIGINKNGSEFIYLEGEFGTNTYKNFIQFLKEADTEAKEIKISSNGGLLSTAMEIGSYVYENKWNTGVDKEMHCFSACSFVYFAGREKSLEGKAVIGLHRPYMPTVKDTPQSIRKTKREYISYWNYIKAPKSIYDEMMLVDRDNLFLLNRSNIDEYIDVRIK